MNAKILTLDDGFCYYLQLKLRTGVRVESLDGYAVFHGPNGRKVKMQKGIRSDRVVQFCNKRTYTIFNKTLNDVAREVAEYLEVPM
jgi:hypothetical protein